MKKSVVVILILVIVALGVARALKTAKPAPQPVATKQAAVEGTVMEQQAAPRKTVTQQAEVAAPAPTPAVTEEPPGEPLVPGETRADPKMQGNLLRYIDMLQRNYARGCPYEVVDTKAVGKDSQGTHEEWVVKSCEDTVVYPITLKPAEGKVAEVAIRRPAAFAPPEVQKSAPDAGQPKQE